MAGKSETSSHKRANPSTNRIGQRLRQLRQEGRFTLRSLAERVGVTASLLSQIETGQANPSVDTLYGLAEALDVPATCFFETAEQHARHGEATDAALPSPVVRPPDRRCIELANGVIWQSLLTAEEPGFEFCEVHYPPGSVSAEKMEQHAGKHCLVILEGTLTVQLAFTTHHLAVGDSIAFEAGMPHQLRNEGLEPVRAVLTLLQRSDPGFVHRNLNGEESPTSPG